MSPIEILQDLQKRPFEPFRFEVSDGTHYNIMHPELCMVGLSSVIIGLAPDPATPLYDRTVKVDCSHIVKQVPLPSQPKPGTNGTQPG
jgi:hypothetical protein